MAIELEEVDIKMLLMLDNDWAKGHEYIIIYEAKEHSFNNSK
jgi:hypothetical protein